MKTKHKGWRRSRSMVVGLTLTAMIAGACGGDDGDASDADTSSGGTEAPAEAGLTKVKATTLGLCNESNMYWGVEQGVFEKHGLEVELVRSAGGAAGVAALMSGAVDFSFTNGFTSIISFTQGFPLRFASSAYEIAMPPLPKVSSLAVKADSPLQSAKDVVGKRVGVNELGGVNQIAVNQWLRKGGVDPKDVNFVALPFSELVSAVGAGRIDVAAVPLANILSQPTVYRSLGDPFVEGVGNVVFAAYLVTEEFLEDNEETAKAFLAAMDESTTAAEDPANAQALAEASAKRCGGDASVLIKQLHNDYEAYVDYDLLKDMAGVLVEEGMLREVPDIEQLVPEFARKK